MSTLKKSISIVLAILMLISVFTVVPLTAGAAETHKRHTKADTEKKPTKDICGDFEYYIEEGNAVISSYKGNDENVVVPETLDGYTVTVIDGDTFEDCSFIKNVTLPDTIEFLNNYIFSDTAFYKDESNWENGVFYAGKYLINAKDEDDDNPISGTYNIKPGTIVIASGAFNYCTDLKKVTIPDSVKTMCFSAFYACKKLTDISIGNGISIIPEDAFNECRSLESVTIPNSVKAIEGYAFAYCEKLTNLTLPDSVTSIGYSAFAFCTQISTVTIPNSVTDLGTGVFRGCSNLTSINVAADNSDYCSIDGILYSKDKTKLMQYAAGKTDTNFTVPNYVTKICDDSFYECGNLTSVTISNGVKEIDFAFAECSNLSTINLPDSITSIKKGAFSNTAYYNDQKNWDNYLLYIGKYLVAGKNYDDYNDNLISGAYTIKPGTLLIANSVFEDCYQLKSISIPNSVKYINDEAFYCCEALTSLTIPDSVISISYCSFFGCSALTSITLGKNLKEIDTWAFEACEKLTSVTIPDNVTYIRRGAFYKCSNLANVTIGKNVKEIGKYAFEDTALKSVTIPANVTTIEDYSFGYNDYNDNGDDVKLDNFTINGYAGTAAEKYASANGFKFVKLTPPKKVKQANTLKVSAKTKAVKAKKLKKKKQTVKPLTIKNAKGAVTVTKVKKGSAAKLFKKITVNKKTGAITIKKGKYAKKTYKIKLKITAKGNSSYNSKTLTKVVKIKVK